MRKSEEKRGKSEEKRGKSAQKSVPLPPLDTIIMIMWRHSVSKDESLDPLVELLFLACISMVNIIPCYFYSLLSLVLSSSLS